MIKISRMADYGVLILTHIASKPRAMYSSQYLSEVTNLNIPTVTKVLKQLSKAGVLSSCRGVGGGYCLSRSATCITVADIVEAIDGPITLTYCAVPNNEKCK